MIVLMTEEQSMRATLQLLIRRNFPEAVEGVDWLVRAFQGKQDLERRLLDALQNWSFGEPHFVVIRDEDSGECRAIKANLTELVQSSGRAVTVRIVCKELESWLLGDDVAVKTAYPRARISSKTAKYRFPDRLVNASQELGRVTGDFTKEVRAVKIAAHLEPERNVSPSFQVTFKTLKDHLEGR